MEIKKYQINSFLKEVKKYQAGLIYGVDEGIVKEYKDNIIKEILGENYDPFLYTELSAENFKKEPYLLKEEIANLCLIEGRRLILVRNTKGDNKKLIEEILSQQKTDVFVLFLSDNLAKTLALVKYFGQAKNLFTIPCYNDEIADVIQLVRTEFKNYQIDNDTISYIAHNIFGNRDLIRNEIEKIKLFQLNNKNILHNDVVELLSTHNDADFQKFANFVFDKNIAQATKILEELQGQGFPAVTLIRVLINYLQRISLVKDALENNQSYEQAISKLQPPLFFKQKDIFQKHFNNLKKRQVENYLVALFKVEKMTKSYSAINEDILFKFLILMMR